MKSRNGRTGRHGAARPHHIVQPTSDTHQYLSGIQLPIMYDARVYPLVLQVFFMLTV